MKNEPNETQVKASSEANGFFMFICKINSFFRTDNRNSEFSPIKIHGLGFLYVPGVKISRFLCTFVSINAFALL